MNFGQVFSKGIGKHLHNLHQSLSDLQLELLGSDVVADGFVAIPHVMILVVVAYRSHWALVNVQDVGKTRGLFEKLSGQLDVVLK